MGPEEVSKTVFRMPMTTEKLIVGIKKRRADEDIVIFDKWDAKDCAEAIKILKKAIKEMDGE